MAKHYDASDIEASNIKIAFSATPEYYPAAQKLLTPRKIGLANFDGTADITVDQIGEADAEKIGLFGAGDCLNKPVKQVVTACADGAIAARKVVNYLNTKE